MEKPIYPSSNMRITQGYGKGTHKDSYAIDDAGKDTGIDPIKAPFTGIIKKIYTNDANEVWLESVEEVEYPDGTIDYMTVMFAHCNDVNSLFVGKRIEQGEEFYSEGTKGNASGNHCHIECGQGKFTDPGWYKNNSGYYSMNNGKPPEECLWVDDSINVIDNHNYNFKLIEEKEEESSLENESATEEGSNDLQNAPEEDEIISKDESEKKPKLIYTCKKTDLYGIYLKENQNVYID